MHPIRPLVIAVVAVTLLAGFGSPSLTAAPLGPTGGPVRQVDVVAGQDFVMYTVHVGVGRSTFQLRGDGSSDIDLYLFELDGTPIEVSNSISDRERISRWFSERRTIVVTVVNVGRRASPFVLTID